MRAVIFTFPPDYLAASLAARAALTVGVEPVLCIDRKDPELIVDGARVRRTDFLRVGNLNGARCVRGILETLAEEAEGEWILKLDSDTLLFNLDWLKGRSEAVVGRCCAKRELYGFCYAVRTSALPALRHAAENLSDPFCNEDRTLAGLAGSGLFTFPPGHACPLRSYAWKGAAASWREHGAVVVHSQPGQGRREVTRAMENLLR